MVWCGACGVARTRPTPAHSSHLRLEPGTRPLQLGRQQVPARRCELAKHDAAAVVERGGALWVDGGPVVPFRHNLLPVPRKRGAESKDQTEVVGGHATGLAL